MTNLQKLEKHIAENIGVKTSLLEALDYVLPKFGKTIKWELGKPLSKQSQQTINFLLEIFENE